MSDIFNPSEDTAYHSMENFLNIPVITATACEYLTTAMSTSILEML